MKYIEILLLPGNEITAVEELITEGHIPERPVTAMLGGPYTKKFNNGYTFQVQAINAAPPHIEAQLRDEEGVILDSELIDGSLDQDYQFLYNQDAYRLTIIRAANTVLSPEEAMLYVEQGGRRCPFCGCDDMHLGSLQASEAIAWRNVTCCACQAEWSARYQLTEVVVMTPPQTNVARPPGA